MTLDDVLPLLGLGSLAAASQIPSVCLVRLDAGARMKHLFPHDSLGTKK